MDDAETSGAGAAGAPVVLTRPPGAPARASAAGGGGQDSAVVVDVSDGSADDGAAAGVGARDGVEVDSMATEFTDLDYDQFAAKLDWVDGENQEARERFKKDGHLTCDICPTVVSAVCK